jgi:hypothetical protein
VFEKRCCLDRKGGGGRERGEGNPIAVARARVNSRLSSNAVTGRDGLGKGAMHTREKCLHLPQHVSPEGVTKKDRRSPSGGERGSRGREGAAAPSFPGEVRMYFSPKYPPPGSDLIRICPLTVQKHSLSSAAVHEKNAFKVCHKKN